MGLNLSFSGGPLPQRLHLHASAAALRIRIPFCRDALEFLWPCTGVEINGFLPQNYTHTMAIQYGSFNMRAQDLSAVAYGAILGVAELAGFILLQGCFIGPCKLRYIPGSYFEHAPTGGPHTSSHSQWFLNLVSVYGL